MKDAVLALHNRVGSHSNGLLNGPIVIDDLRNSLECLFSTQLPEVFLSDRIVFWEGDGADHVFHVLSGYLRACRIMEDGRRAILRLIYPGEILGLSFGSCYLYTLEAVTPIRFRRLSRRSFDDLLKESVQLRAQLRAEVGDEIGRAQDQIANLGRTTADERVAAFLLSSAKRAGAVTEGSVKVNIPFSRLDIADYLGLTVETVSREISKLKRDGLISMDGPHAIILRHIRALQTIAGVSTASSRGCQPVKRDCH